jgi:hypothetical protein
MAINLNVSPYYDDFDANKKFNRVVFKPGVAVQARELTQMQDYFYETIKDFADHLFVDGAAVSGCEGGVNLLEYIKVNDIDASGDTVSNDTLANYVGDSVVGATTGMKAKIDAVKIGNQSDPTAKKVLYITYNEGNKDGAGDGLNKRFDGGETLTVISSNSDRNDDTFVTNSDVDTTTFTNSFYGLAMDFVIPEGVLYVQGKFVKHETQKIRLDDYSARTNYFIGVILKEDIITSDDDGTLLDPATGAFNYNAPGADRTKVHTEIAKVPFGQEFVNNKYFNINEHVAYEDRLYTVTVAGTTSLSGSGPTHTSGSALEGSAEFTFYQFPENFTSIYKVANGAIVKKINEELKQYESLGRTLATRTYEESGNYVVEPFTLELMEHLKTVKGTVFNTTTNTTYAPNQFVNFNGNLYYVSNTSAAEADRLNPPIHTSGEVTSGAIKFVYAGDSFRFDNEGYQLPNAPVDPGDSNYLVAKVSPGIAYVEGYRRDFGAGEGNTYVKIRKGTSSKIQEGLDINLGYGNFFEVKEVCGDWNMEEGTIVAIYKGSAKGAVTAASHSGTAVPASTDKIGECRVRSIKNLSGVPGAAAARYRIFVYDVRILKDNLKDAAHLYYLGDSGGSFADIIPKNGIDIDGNAIEFATLDGTQANKMLFRCPWRATKTFYAAGSGTLDTQYYYTEEFGSLSTLADGTFTVNISSLGTEFSFPYSATPAQDQLNAAFYLVNRGNAFTLNGTASFPSSTTINPGQIIPMTPAMIVSYSLQEMDFDITEGGGVGTISGAADLYLQVKLKVTDAPPVTKNLNINRYVKIRTVDNAGGSLGPWNLGLADVREIEAIYICDGEREGGYLDDDDDPVNYKDDFQLDSGQQDNFYGHARLIKKGGVALDMSNKLITVKLSHFEPDYNSSNATYFAYDSYPVDDTGATGIYTFEVPYYRSKLFGTFDLRDCVDFRPYVENTAVSAQVLGGATQNPYKTNNFDLPTNGIQYPIPASAFTTDVEYYLPRVDRLFINKFGDMAIREGVSEIPAKPPVLKQGMQIAEIRVPPFPSIPRKVAKKVGKVESAARHILQGQTRRYTMADIGNIEKRIDRLEYYLALSLMEMAAKDKQILDANGNDRFKNGIYVNPFDSDLLSDLADPSYNAAYNSIAKECEPNYDESDISLILNPTYDNSGWDFMGQMITRPYTRTALFENRFATKTRNLVGELLFNFTGKMELFPRSDNFASTTTMEPMHLTSSNQAAVQASAASITNSKNVIGTSSSITVGAVNAGGQTIGYSNEPSTSTSTFSTNGDGIPFTESETTSYEGAGPPGSTNPMNPGGWWEQVSEGSQTTTTTGTHEITGTTSTTTSTSSIVQSTTEYLLTASARGAGKLEFMIGDVVRDVSLLPYMRARPIGVRCSGLKPKTRLYCFFDDENVTEFCRLGRINSKFLSGNKGGPGFDNLARCGVMPPNPYGGAIYSVCQISVGEPSTHGTFTQDPNVLVTDEHGDIAFIFNLPGDRFPVGTRRIFVVDDPTNRNNFITTMAENQYSAFGMHQTTQAVSLTAELYQLEYGSTTGGTSTSVVGSVVTGVETSTSISVDKVDVETNVDTTNPEYVFHPPLRFGDPIAQSFTIENVPTEGFLSRIKVWFRQRPGQKDGVADSTTHPDQTGTGRKVTMEIRECNDAGYPTNKIIGKSTVPFDQIATTPDISGGQATNFEFTDQYSTNFDFGSEPEFSVLASAPGIGHAQAAPVVLDPAKEYAFIIIPENNDPHYDIWCSKLGETKIGTKADRVTAEETYSGILFTSANNRTWTPHQQEDLKFVLYLHEFATGTGTVEFANANAEFVSGKDFVGGKPDQNDPGTWYSFRNTINAGGSGHSVGDLITMNTTRTNCPKGIIFEVISVDGSGAVTGIKANQYHDGSATSYNDWPWSLGRDGISLGVYDPESSSVPPPLTDATLEQASSTGSGVGFTCNMRPKKMYMQKVDNVLDRYDFYLPPENQDNELNVAGILAGDTTLLPQVDDLWFQRIIGKRAFYIKEAGLKKIINTSRTNMTLRDYTSTDTNITRATTLSSGVNQRGSTFESMTPTMLRPTLQETAVYSLSDELSFAVGTDIWSRKSYRHRVEMTNNTVSASPVLNPMRTSAEVREYIVNNDATDETEPLGGNARSRFISKIVRLADGQEAEDVLLSVAQFTPPGSDVKVYFKGVSAEDDLDIRREKNWIEMEYGTSNPTGSLNKNRFVDMEYQLPKTSLNSNGKYFYSTDRLDPDALTLSQGAGYENLQQCPVFVTGGTSTDIVIKSLNNNGNLLTFDVLNPGANFGGSVPTIKIGFDHEGSEQYAVNTVVADTDATGSVERIFKCITAGTTAALSEGENPGTQLDKTANPSLVAGVAQCTDGTCVWLYLGERAVFSGAALQTVEYTGFKYFQCKIVMIAENTSLIPKLKQLRMIAMMAGVQDTV